jgi:outer membrane receptor protein involved in Fe transport
MGSGTLQAAEPRYRFDVPPAPLELGVQQISAVAGVSIVTADSRLLEGQGHGVHMTGTTGDALSALLSGTAAKARKIDSAGFRIVPRHQRTSRLLSRSIARPAMPEIIVLGSKRNLPLSTYPASVSVIDGSSLGRFGASPDTDAIVRLNPVLQSTHLGPGRDKLFLRGIADSSFIGSSAALVGAYVGDLRLTYNAPNPDLQLYDISRVEILEGTQGTLYGAGSLAGLIRVTPNIPDVNALTGEFWVGGTNVAHGTPGADAGGLLNVPLVPGTAALRIVAYVAHDGGYIDDPGRRIDDVNASRKTGGRAALRFNLGSLWALDFNSIVQDIRNRDAQYVDRGQPALTRSSDAAQPSFNLFRAGDIILSGPIGSTHLTATTGFVHQSLDQHFLPALGSVTSIYGQRDLIRLLSEEARLSNGAGSWLGWVAGLSVLNSRTDQVRSSTLDGHTGSLGRARNTLTDLTAFGELTVHLRPTLDLTAGVRLSTVWLLGVASGADAKGIDTGKGLPDSTPHQRGHRQEHFAVPTLALAWRPSMSWLLFARYSEGYRPGGQTASGVIERFDADRIDTLEAGVRLRPQGRSRLSAQLAGVLSWWRNVQADVLGANGLPITQNVGNGMVRSLNASLDWKPTGDLDAQVAATLARGHVTGRDRLLDIEMRTPLPNVAHDSLTASVNYAHAFNDNRGLVVGLSLHHVGHSVLGSGSELSLVRQGGYWEVSSGAEFRTGANTLSIDVENLLDNAADRFAFGMPAVSIDNHALTPLRPRTVRLGLRRIF